MATEGPSAERVAQALAEATGDDPGRLRLTPIPGGASRETWLVEGDAGRWVLRRDPPGSQSFVSLAVEHGVVAAAARAGVPVPTAIRLEPDGGRFGTPGYLMRHVEGESVGPRVLRRDELAPGRERIVSQLGEALARIHSLGPGDVDGVADPDGDPALAACSLWESALDDVGEPLPATETGLRWLRLNQPPPVNPRLVHGDFRLGNFIVSPRGLEAVIDWELCHLGDPAEDIAWLCIRSWRFGNDDLEVGGLGGLDELLEAYERAGGTRPDAERLRWWAVMGNVKWAVICARQSHDHLSGTRRSAELASLGRRICEPEWDMLQLVSHHGASVRVAAPGAPRSGRLPTRKLR